MENAKSTSEKYREAVLAVVELYGLVAEEIAWLYYKDEIEAYMLLKESPK